MNKVFGVNCLSGFRTVAAAFAVVLFGTVLGACVALEPLDEEGGRGWSGLVFDDCNDNDPTTWSGADEVCDGKDNNCNDQVDEGLGPTCCQADADCADADLCNGAETCVNHACQAGSALSCDDSNACTTDSCDPATGCKNDSVANSTECADADLCNGTETCVDGACAAGSSLDCDDSDVCTTDACDPATGCGNTAITGCCHYDQGAAGDAECVPSKPANLADIYIWGCFPNNTCSACEDVDLDGHCAQNSPGGIGEQLCTDGYDGDGDGLVDCADTDCESCSDLDSCNGSETCVDGACAAGVALNCDDGNKCTTDACDPATGCKNEALADGASCVDGTVCNGAETCVDGACAAGVALNCDDGNKCTTDACDPATGCGHSAVECPAGQTCNASTGSCCAPNCTGKECGDDGCGGSCGTCADGEACDTAGQCQVLFTFTWKRNEGGLETNGVINFATPDSCPQVASTGASPDLAWVVFTGDPTTCEMNVKLVGGAFDPGCWDQPISKPDAAHPDTNGDGIADACGPKPQGTATLFCETAAGTVKAVPNVFGNGLNFLLTCP